MTFTSIHQLSDFINDKHYTFAGRSIRKGCANVRTFDTLMRNMDYLKKESAAKSVTFDASIYVGGSVIPTQITIGITSSGFEYTEAVVY